MKAGSMNNLMDVPPTSTSPLSNCAGGRNLVGSVVPLARLTAEARDRMYVLLTTYFARTCRGRFDADLAEKESVVLLRDRDTEEIQGFSTFMRIEISVNERDIVAFFSGDTIV